MALSHHGWPAPKSLPSPRFLFPCAGHAGRDAMFQPSRGLILAVFNSAFALTSGSLQAFPSLQPLLSPLIPQAHTLQSQFISAAAALGQSQHQSQAPDHIEPRFSADDVVMPRPEFSGLPCYVQLFCSSSLISSPAGPGPEASALKPISIPGLAESFAMVSCECWSCHQAG